MSLAQTLTELKAFEPGLRAKGVCALYLFGSRARGEGRPGSDLDLAFDIAPGRKFSLFDQAEITCDLGAALGVEVDFVPRRALHPFIRDRVEAEKVKVFG